MRFCSRRCDDALPTAGDNPKADDWLRVRRFYIRSLRCQTRSVILLLALTEALKHGPLELVYAGRQGFAAPGENDYGVSGSFLHPYDREELKQTTVDLNIDSTFPRSPTPSPTSSPTFTSAPS
jgi:hypothetical protein